MPDLAEHKSVTSTKMLLIGDSGSGKTGALASLAKAGYNLRIMDFDAGLDVLSNLLRDPRSPYGKEALSRVKFVTLTDAMRTAGGKLIPAKATVWQRAIGLLDNWQVKEGDKIVEDLGPLVTWTDKDILVIDSLTMLSTAALNFQLSLNGRLGGRVEQGDWYAAQQMVEGLLQKLYDDNVKCNVIVISHITYIESDNGPSHGYPSTLGKSLPPKVGRYFNSVLMAKTTGSGQAQKRRIFTTTIGAVELKNTAPLRVQAEYPLDSGLASYFKDVRDLKGSADGKG
jgi:hypothetical protein